MSKRPRGNIHKIREFELEKIHLVDEFDILQIVGEGWFGKILLVEHRASHTEMVLKAVPKPYVSLRDFYREFHYGLHLGIHRNIVTTYDVAFETAGFYVFTQEYAPLGDLTSNVTDNGVGEINTKRVAKQIASALDYMHAKDIVHRDVKLDNILIYRANFTRVKLCDFGESYQIGTVVERRNEWLPYSPPEVLEIKPEGTYKADPSHDVWQFAIVIFVCLTGCLPWQKAASDDPRYMRYLIWQNTMMLANRRTPKLFKLLSSRAQRMFKRFLEPRIDKRPKNLSDLTKYLDNRWLAKTAEKEMAEYETDELCPSMYSFHSSPDEKNRLLYNLADYGLETNVDRNTKKMRIKEWIESSVITEDEEEPDENNSASSPSSSVSREPVHGHVSSLRTNCTEKPKEIKTTLKDANQKHFDPRTGVIQQGPSEMGIIDRRESNIPFSTASNISIINNNYSLADSILTLDELNDSLDQLSYLTINNSNLALTQIEDYVNSSPQLTTTKNSIGVNTGSYLTPNKSILQNTNSDSPKKALDTSTPTLDNNNSSAWNMPNMGTQQHQNNKSVTFMGLANSFKTMAPIIMPTNLNINMKNTTTSNNKPTSQNQTQIHSQNQHNNSDAKSPCYDSPVKDSAYGSSENTNDFYISHQTNSNDKMNRQNTTFSTVRTQSSQQQRSYIGALTSPNNIKK